MNKVLKSLLLLAAVGTVVSLVLAWFNTDDDDNKWCASSCKWEDENE